MTKNESKTDVKKHFFAFFDKKRHFFYFFLCSYFFYTYLCSQISSQKASDCHTFFSSAGKANCTISDFLSKQYTMCSINIHLSRRWRASHRCDCHCPRHEHRYCYRPRRQVLTQCSRECQAVDHLLCRYGQPDRQHQEQQGQCQSRSR